MRLRWLGVSIALAVALTLALPSAAFAPPRPLFAAMNGQNEISEDGEPGAGDRNGGGSFSAVIKGRQLCYGIAVKDIQDPIAAHIHRGRAGVNGDIVVPLTQPESGNPGASSGCTRIRARLVRAIRRNPERYYVNVHTPDFEAGAVRGQLFSRGA